MLKRENAFPGKKAGKRTNPAITEFAGNLSRFLVLILCLGLGLCGGCGFYGPSTKYITSQALPQLQSQDRNKELQHQLMVQATRSSLVNYKDYRVGAEDLLVVDVYGQEALKRELRVNGQGNINMPLVGVVKVAGLTTREVEKRLTELYGSKFFRNPQISVEVKEFHHQRVAVTGAVRKPGFYEIIGPRTLLEVLAIAEGVANDPNRSEAGDVVHVIRHQSAVGVAKTITAGSTQSFSPQTKTTVINLRRLLSGEAPELNLTVENGDVVHVPFAATAYVLGGVKKPGKVAVKDDLTVSQAVAQAGGIDYLYGTNRIDVIRFDEQGRPLTIQTNLSNIAARKDPDILVKENDVILVKIGQVKTTLWVIRQLLPIPSGGYSLGTL